jgi:Tfp pilus assembly protein PilN
MRSLPRRNASPTFTSEVLRKARRTNTKTERSVPWIWRMSAGVAMAACLVVVVVLAQVQFDRRHEAQLRAEQKQLQAELQAVKKVANAPEPAVVFENNRGERVIVDLETGVQPASYRTFD